MNGPVTDTAWVQVPVPAIGEGRVTTVPGDAFGPGGAGWLRVSLGGPLAELEEGLARLAPWWKA